MVRFDVFFKRRRSLIVLSLYPGRRCRNWALPFLNVPPLDRGIEGRLWRARGRRGAGGGGRQQRCQGCASPSCCKKVASPLTISLAPPKHSQCHCYWRNTVCDSRIPTWGQWGQGWQGWPSVRRPAPRCSRCCPSPCLSPASPSCASPIPPTACSGPMASLSIPRSPSKRKEGKVVSFSETHRRQNMNLPVAILEPLMSRLKCPRSDQKLGRSLWRALPWRSLVSSSSLVCSQQDGGVMLFTGAEQDWAGTCCLLKQHCHHPPLLSHHWLSGGWRLLAPLAESLVGHVGTRHSTAEWRHSDVEHSGTPSMIIGLLVLQTVIFAWTPSEKREFQSISAGAREVANGWRRPPPQWYRRHPSNRLQTRKQLQGGVPTLSIPFTSLNLVLVGTIEFGFFRIHFNYEMLWIGPVDKFGMLSSGHVTGWLVSALEGWWTASQPLTSITSSPSAVAPQPLCVHWLEEFCETLKSTSIQTELFQRTMVSFLRWHTFDFLSLLFSIMLKIQTNVERFPGFPTYKA